MSEKCLCSYNSTRKNYTAQFWYSCRTCTGYSSDIGCCLACAVSCHKDHQLDGPKYSNFFCDCGANGMTDGKKEPFKCTQVQQFVSKPFDPKNHTGFTFAVNKLQPNLRPLPTIKLGDLFKDYDRTFDSNKIISTSLNSTESFFSDGWRSKFLETINFAYSNHLPLKLSPSHFLLMISQGLATHINQNAEELRKYLVTYEDKQQLAVTMHDYDYGKLYDWTKIFDQFTELIKTDVNPEIYAVVKDEFSCSTSLSRACADVALMDCMKSFCVYYGSCCDCGIVRVTLDGTPEDWKILRDKVYRLETLSGTDDKLKLGWWLSALIPVINKICDAGINHTIDTDFWSKIYNFTSGSGVEYASGWITVFFPYFHNDDKIRENRVISTKKNTYLNWEIGESQVDIGNDPANISSVDFILDYEKEFTEKLKMKFYAGFFGTIQYDDLTVEPMLGWVVTHEDKK